MFLLNRLRTKKYRLILGAIIIIALQGWVVLRYLDLSNRALTQKITLNPSQEYASYFEAIRKYLIGKNFETILKTLLPKDINFKVTSEKAIDEISILVEASDSKKIQEARTVLNRLFKQGLPDSLLEYFQTATFAIQNRLDQFDVAPVTKEALVRLNLESYRSGISDQMSIQRKAFLRELLSMVDVANLSPEVFPFYMQHKTELEELESGHPTKDSSDLPMLKPMIRTLLEREHKKYKLATLFGSSLFELHPAVIESRTSILTLELQALVLLLFILLLFGASKKETRNQESFDQSLNTRSKQVKSIQLSKSAELFEKAALNVAISRSDPIFVLTTTVGSDHFTAPATLTLGEKFAAQNLEVLLVDLCQDRSAVSRKLELQDTPGLWDHIYKDTELSDCIQKVSEVSYLRLGQNYELNTEIIDHPKFKKIVENQSDFDVVIFIVQPGQISDFAKLSFYSEQLFIFSDKAQVKKDRLKKVMFACGLNNTKEKNVIHFNSMKLSRELLDPEASHEITEPQDKKSISA